MTQNNYNTLFLHCHSGQESIGSSLWGTLVYFGLGHERCRSDSPHNFGKRFAESRLFTSTRHGKLRDREREKRRDRETEREKREDSGGVMEESKGLPCEVPTTNVI